MLPSNIQRTVTTYGATPITEQRTVTTCVEPLFSSHISYEIPTRTVTHIDSFRSATEDVHVTPGRAWTRRIDPSFEAV